MTDPAVSRGLWAVVLGASSGFGRAIALSLARAGFDIAGFHLDRRHAMPAVIGLRDELRGLGRHVIFHNLNAADSEKCPEIVDELATGMAQFAPNPKVAVFVHSLAFGSLGPLIADGQAEALVARQLDMTSRVMAHSLVFWVQELCRTDLFASWGRVFALTSAGSSVALPGYGAVGAAKAALESYVRQLAVELAPRKITVNAISAGVADTPALRQIPAHLEIIQGALRRNPSRRLTTPDDVASAISALCDPGTHWMTGNVIRVDGGEGSAG